MFLFHFHAAFSLSLIALALGGALLVWAKANKNVGTILPKVIAYVVVVVAALNFLCFGAGAIKHWKQGHFKHSPLSIVTKERFSPNKYSNRMMDGIRKTGKKLRLNK